MYYSHQEIGFIDTPNYPPKPRWESVKAVSTDFSACLWGLYLDILPRLKTRESHGTARFFDAGELNHYRREFEKVRGNLQQTGTQSAHRTLETLSNREDRYVKHVLHSVANGIVEEAVEHECDGIIFEDLTDIREDLPFAAWHSEWAFRKLKDYVEYKAEFEGLFVDTVNPRNTSKRCNECGFTHDSNRHAGEFECVSCGKSNHADYNAAKNVAELYLRRGHQPSSRRSVSQYALKSGSRTPS